MILDHGKIIFDGDLSEIKALPGLERTLIVDFPGEAPLDALEEKFATKLSFAKETERRLKANYNPQQVSTVELIREIVSECDVSDLAVSEPTIEQVIMKIYRDGIDR